MPVTTNLSLSVPPHGGNVNTWDSDPINNNSTILDAVFGSVTSKSLTNANVTLSTTESRVNILRFSGVLSGNVIITLGAIIKSWTVENITTGAFTITVKGSPGTGNIVGLPPGSCQIYWDGTNVNFLNLGRVGEYLDYSGSAVPSWISACTVPPYLICDGTTYSSGTYPLLFAILGTTTLPDSRGRTRFALNGGTGRLTTGGGIDGNTAYASGGFGTGLAITQANLPVVNFGLSINDTRAWGFNYQVRVVAAGGSFSVIGADAGGLTQAVPVQSGSISGTAASGGSGTAMTSVPPGYVGGIVLIKAN